MRTRVRARLLSCRPQARRCARPVPPPSGRAAAARLNPRRPCRPATSPLPPCHLSPAALPPLPCGPATSAAAAAAQSACSRPVLTPRSATATAGLSPAEDARLQRFVAACSGPRGRAAPHAAGAPANAYDMRRSLPHAMARASLQFMDNFDRYAYFIVLFTAARGSTRPERPLASAAFGCLWLFFGRSKEETEHAFGPAPGHAPLPPL